MRISTGEIFDGALGLMLQQQYQIAHTQQQLSSGKRISSPADDPGGAATLVGLDQSLKTTQQYQSNIASARSRLTLEESTLSSMTDVLNRIRELTVQANNAAVSNSDRGSIAAEIQQDLDQLLSLANTKESNGEYIFAGYQAGTQPFGRDPVTGRYVYNGDAGSRLIQIGPARQVAIGDSGQDAFVMIRNGNGTFTVSDSGANTGSGVITPVGILQQGVYDGGTYTVRFPVPAAPGADATQYEVTDKAGNIVASGSYVDGGQISFAGIAVKITGTPKTGDTFTVSPSTNQDLFTTIGNLLSALQSGGNSTAFANAAGRALSDIDQAMENISATRARVGSRLQALDSQESINGDSLVRLQDATSQLRDLDYASGVTLLNRQMLGLDAAQKSFLQIQNLSLFKYL
jgi:flagellar hook-associated protein 3 FlgL